jgi:signal transduction histidine kinase
VTVAVYPEPVPLIPMRFAPTMDRVSSLSMNQSPVAAAAPERAEPSRRDRGKERLYVACQAGGWGVFLAFQLAITNAISSSGFGRWDLVVQTVTLGLLVTHYSRPLIHRWGWKELGSRALLPRMIGLATVQSLVWCLVGYGIAYGLLGYPPSPKVPMSLLFIISFVNGVVLLLMWLSFYFFYNIYDRNNRLELDRARLTAMAKEAELRALKSQVNPHFIFNALNSLRALIDEDPARARLAVTQLANLLRYSLQSAQAETVAFEDELRVVHDYLALEQVRHEERLRVRLDVAPETLGLAVPPLLLQTLVENAVKYGISTRPDGGEVVITARCEQGSLELRVINPGELAPTPKAGTDGASTGVGLRNAADRLRMFFGDRARLQLRRGNAAEVIAEVSIPAQPARA